MCRLAAYLGAPLSPARLVFDGSHSLYEQSWAPRELLSGTLNADGDYSFDRYVEDVDPGDFLVIGDVSDGSSAPTPGGYIAVETNV